MRLNLRIILTLFSTELRMLLRDRRVLLTSIALPLLIMPLMFLATNWSMKRREHVLRDMECQYAVTGPRADLVRTLLADIRKETATQKATNTARFTFNEKGVTNALDALAKGELHIVLEALEQWTNATPEKARAAKRRSRDEGSRGSQPALDASAIPGVPAIQIVYRGDRDDSLSCMGRMADTLEESRGERRIQLLKSREFSIAPADLARVSEHNLASGGQIAGSSLGKFLTVMLLVFVLTSGTVVATDSLAGEKERGTLETLLTTGVRRTDVLTAKQLVILAVALGVTLIQALNLLVYVSFKLLPVPANLSAALPPWVAALLFLLFLPVAALAANILLLVSGYARSYKEAQLYFFPVFLLALVPALAPLLPGVPLRSAIVLIPVSNLAIAAREVLIGSFDWLFIGLAWIITASAAWWTTRWGVRVLSTERLITAAETDEADYLGGPALYEKRVLPWFACLWAALIIVNNYTTEFDIRAQLVINLVVIFMGATLLMLGRYRLPVRSALALRLPRPAVWFGVLLGVPGGMLTAIGFFRLVNLIIPVPPKVIESFSESVLPPDVPPAQLLLFLALLPGVCEEILFRGMLLHGLRRRLHPAMLAIVVGLVFGIFHVALFRFAPTALLGVMLAVVTLLSGSIYPAMLWHALNNGLGMLAGSLQISEHDLPLMAHVAGLGSLTLAFWIIWRNRTPYPDLRPWRGKKK